MAPIVELNIRCEQKNNDENQHQCNHTTFNGYGFDIVMNQ